MHAPAPANRPAGDILGDVDAPFTIRWYLDQPARIIPTWKDNPKNTEKGYTRESTCTEADFCDGRWAKIVTGQQQPDAPLYLYAFDEDVSGELLPRIERYAPDLIDRFLHARSTSGRGLHLWFYTNIRADSFTVCDPDTGELLIEFKGCGAWLTAPRPESIIHYGRDRDDFPFISASQVAPLLDAMRPAPKPIATPPSRPATALAPALNDTGRTSFDILAYCRAADLPALVEADGAVYAGEHSGVMHYHCHSSAHKNGDKNPSLRVYPSDKYGYVAKCNHPGCDLGRRAQNAFDYQRNRRGLTAAGFLQEINPLDHTAIARAKDADRKRNERGHARDARLDEVRAKLAADTKIPERARKLVEVLLADGLQSRKTNAQLAEVLGVHPNTIVNAFRDMAAAGYGRRVGGILSGDKGIPAVWTFLDHKPEEKPLINAPVPIDCDAENELVILKESISIGSPAAELSSFPFNMVGAETEKREKEGSQAPTTPPPREAAEPEPTTADASYDPAAALQLAGEYTGRSKHHADFETRWRMSNEAIRPRESEPARPASAGQLFTQDEPQIRTAPIDPDIAERYYKLRGRAKYTKSAKQRAMLSRMADDLMIWRPASEVQAARAERNVGMIAPPPRPAQLDFRMAA